MPLKQPGSFEKWINLEYRNINKNMVARRLYIYDVIKMEIPKAETKAGEEYLFDKKALKALWKKLNKNLKEELKIPIIFFSDIRVSDSCYLTDESAVEALKHTKDLNPMYRIREGKLWLSKPIAMDIANKYPTLFQFVVHSNLSPVVLESRSRDTLGLYAKSSI